MRAEHVDPPDGDWYGRLIDPVQRITAHVRTAVNDAAREFPDVEVDLRIIRRNPVRALVNESAEASLLVVASRGLGGFKGLLLGSVSQGVLSQAAGPVAIVPETSDQRDTSEQPAAPQERHPMSPGSGGIPGGDALFGTLRSPGGPSCASG